MQDRNAHSSHVVPAKSSVIACVLAVRTRDNPLQEFPLQEFPPHQESGEGVGLRASPQPCIGCDGLAGIHEAKRYVTVMVKDRSSNTRSSLLAPTRCPSLLHMACHSGPLRCEKLK